MSASGAGEAARMTRIGSAGRGEGVARVEEEIRRTQAEALGRVGEVLERLLEQLRVADRALDAVPESNLADPSARQRVADLVVARNRVREEAARVRNHLIIQREAIGIARHAAVEQCYPMPERRHRLDATPPRRSP